MTDMLTTIKAAKLTGVSEDTIRRLAATGVIPARKIGAAWAITRPDLDAGLAVWRQTLQERSRAGATARWQQVEEHMAGKLSVKQAAIRAGVSDRAVWDWCNRHDLPFERVPGNGKGAVMRIAIDPAEFDAFVAAWKGRKNGNMAKARETWANLGIEAPSRPPVPVLELECKQATCAAPQGVCKRCGRACVTIGGLCMDCVWGLR